MPSRLQPPATVPVPSQRAQAPAKLFAGTSGWAYTTWKPGFYPKDIPAKRFLDFYASQFTSVEVNYTFGSELKPGQLEGWLAAAPEGFRFTFKAPQRITHFQRLLGSEEVLSSFLDSLKPAAKAKKLGAILFQLPPNFKATEANQERLANFLKLPALRRHQIAFEFRHETWFTETTYQALRNAKAALCIAESEDLVTPEISTGPHIYYRLRIPGGYTPAQVRAFAQRFAAPAADTYVYFKHEAEPTGALNATAMMHHLAEAGR